MGKDSFLRVTTNFFLSAAQPTDQGTESVAFLVVVGTHFISTEVQLFGVKKTNFFLEKGV